MVFSIIMCSVAEKGRKKRKGNGSLNLMTSFVVLASRANENDFVYILNFVLQRIEFVPIAFSEQPRRV